MYDYNTPSVGLPFLNYLFDVDIDDWDYHDDNTSGKLFTDFQDIPAGASVYFQIKPNHTIDVTYALQEDVEKYDKEQEDTDWEHDEGWWKQSFTRKKTVKVCLTSS